MNLIIKRDIIIHATSPSSISLPHLLHLLLLHLFPSPSFTSFPHLPSLPFPIFFSSFLSSPSFSFFPHLHAPPLLTSFLPSFTSSIL
ncbi:hypothetical protein Pcinc_033701 [Petrolisthes cinctipes]|uniref:Uncharacterized protein n=1 Tax=Petrolisthes cinctipes TaxID=88211 RepID=A0AAE1ERW7_PETCI|nr:hypothetical protein Pcinc_033701 [Petrolisthes cinctipes]